jgi:hypothetical protein
MDPWWPPPPLTRPSISVFGISTKKVGKGGLRVVAVVVAFGGWVHVGEWLPSATVVAGVDVSAIIDVSDFCKSLKVSTVIISQNSISRIILKVTTNKGDK